MVKPVTKTSSTPGGLPCPLERRSFRKPAAFAAYMALACALIASTVPASAQVANVCSADGSNCGAGSQVKVPGTAINTTTGLSGTLDGNNGQGYFVSSGATLTVSNGALQNFVANGGAGSGGGLGAGGAIFIDTGGKVVLDSVNVSHNSVIGGLGGTSDSTGGTLNGIKPVTANAPPNGANGTAGVIKVDNSVAFGDGKGNGFTCSSGTACAATGGGNATNGFGGKGGSGAAGTNGWTFDPIDEENLAISIAKVASDVGKVTVDGINVTAWALAAASAYASAANPFENPLAPIVGTFNMSKAVLAGVGLANDTIGLGADVAALTVNQQKVDNWNSLVSQGLAGNGGNGSAGGAGGKGSIGFGGGGGGQGGAYGLTGFGNNIAVDGTGGAGGAGGSGGFGGGGGAGGYGFGAGQNGNGSDGATSTSGSGGAGGAAGFGAGVGSKGGVTGHSVATGGGGGDGYGGAIFVNSGGSLTITGNSTFNGNSALGGSSLNGGVAGSTAGTDIFLMQGSTLILAPGATSGKANVITFNGSIADNSVSSIGASADFPVSGGAYLTVGAGITVFNGQNTYSGQTVIHGGDVVGGVLNTGTNTPGTPNYAFTDGALRANDGVGLPSTSNLNFSGPNQFTGGVLEITGTSLTNGVFAPTTFSRFVSPNPDPTGGGNPGGVQWTGSGGFAALNAPLTVSLSGNAPLTWGVNGFVPVGSSLIFGSADSNAGVTFTNAINIGSGTVATGTAASILVGNNGNAAGSIATMSGILSGTGDLSIGGGGFNGTLNLTAVNTYTGGTYVNSGTLMISGGGSIASSSGLFLGSTAVLDISQGPAGSTPGAGNVVIPTLNGSGTIALGGLELEVKNGGTFSGVLTDGGAGGGTKGSLIVDAGAAPLTLLGTNTYTGDTTINSGATLVLAGNGSISLSSPIIDNGTFDITQLAGGTAIQTLQGSGQALIGSNLLLITNGTSTTTPSTWFSGVISGTGGILGISGGTETLSGINTYTGSTIIAPPSGGTATLALAGTGSILTSSQVLVGAGGTFDISQTTAGASIQTLLGSGNVALGSGAQTLTITNASTRFDGTIMDGGIVPLASGQPGGNLEIASGAAPGPYALTLSGTNTYTGKTTVDAGATLALTGTGSIAQSSNVIDNGIFDISQTSVGAMIKTLSGNGVASIGANVLIVSNGSTAFDGAIKDGGIGGGVGGALWVAGGIQTLTGNNTYTGVTQISPLVAGGTATLALKGTGSIATSSEVFVATGGTLDISQTTAGASIMTLDGNGSVALGAQTLSITNGSTTFFGVVADGGIAGGTAGNFAVTGGTQTLAGINTYTGDTTIAPNPVGGTATLALAGNGSVATSNKVAIATGGTFDISQTGGTAIKTLADSGASPSGKVALGAQTLFVTDGSTTFSGVIADGGIGGGTAGNFAVTGGTQTLAGVNTYTGVTAIAPDPVGGTANLTLVGNGSIATSSEVFVATGGTFDISGTNTGASITTLAGLGSVALGNQTLTVTAGGAGSDGSNPAGNFAGVISGLGGVAITGGHQELLGLNTYQGGTLVTNGAILSINSSASLGASTSTLTLNNGTLVVDASITIGQPVALIGAPPGTDLINLNMNNVTFSGAISGPGILTAINGGTLNLTGTVSGLGGIVLGPGVTLTASTSANAGIGTTPIVLVPGSGAPLDLFTGSVHVVGPLDVVNGPTAELIILPGDSLVGVGSVNAKVIIQGGGAKAPGDGPGTIFVNGDVVNLPGSTYTVEIDGPTWSATNCTNPVGCAGQYSSVVVTGGNTYTAGGTIAPILRGIDPPANNNYTAPVGSTYTAVLAQGGVLGSFTSLVQPAAGAGLAKGTRFDALYFNADAATPGVSAIDYAQNAAGNPTAVNLWVTPASYQNLSPWNISLTQNQNQVAFALDALRGVNDLNPAASLSAGLKNNAQATWDFGKLFPQQPQNLPGIFNTLSGEVAADAKVASFEMTNQFLNFMLDSSLKGRRGGADALAFAAEEPAVPDSALGYAATAKAPAPLTFDQRWTSWGSAFGGGVNANADAAVGSSSVSARIYGAGGGLDYHWSPDTVTGFAVAGGSTNWNVAQGLGSGRSDAFEGGVYGSTHVGPAYLAGALSAANHWMTTDRTAFASDHLKANFNAQSYGARVEAGWRYAMPGIAVTPYLAGVAQRFSTPTYSETDVTGGGFGLQYRSNSATEIRGEVGARLDSRLAVSDDATLILRGRGAWAYQMVTNPALIATFQAALAPGALPGSGVGFTVNGAVLPKNLGLASVGAELRFTNNWSLEADLRGELGSGSQSYSGTGTVRYGW